MIVTPSMLGASTTLVSSDAVGDSLTSIMRQRATTAAGSCDSSVMRTRREMSCHQNASEDPLTLLVCWISVWLLDLIRPYRIEAVMIVSPTIVAAIHVTVAVVSGDNG